MPDRWDAEARKLAAFVADMTEPHVELAPSMCGEWCRPGDRECECFVVRGATAIATALRRAHRMGLERAARILEQRLAWDDIGGEGHVAAIRREIVGSGPHGGE